MSTRKKNPEKADCAVLSEYFLRTKERTKSSSSVGNATVNLNMAGNGGNRKKGEDSVCIELGTNPADAESVAAAAVTEEVQHQQHHQQDHPQGLKTKPDGKENSNAGTRSVQGEHSGEPHSNELLNMESRIMAMLTKLDSKVDTIAKSTDDMRRDFDHKFTEMGTTLRENSKKLDDVGLA